MEALAAVGVASAAVQFLDFSVKTLALCKEIRDSSDGSTKTNNDLIKSVKVLKAWQKDLQQKCNTTSGAGRRLVETVRACSRIADQLLQLLEHIREVAQKALGTLRAALRALREGKRIEKLQTQLSDCQVKLHLALTAEMRDNLIESLEAQGKNSESMRTIILQKLDFAHDHLRTVDENVTRTAGITQKQISSLNNNQQKSHASLRRGQQHLSRKLDRQLHDLSISSTHQQFLDRLAFEEMFTRQESIKGCSPGTYDWVFSGELPERISPYRNTPKQDAKDLELRGRIVSWLRTTDEQHMFWVNGKPGSGKSSLMSYILSDPRTKVHLQHWAGNRTLHVFSFFFWKPGSSLQKTMLGFRRSMLWQLCKSKPSIINSLLSHDQSLLLTSWTQKKLMNALGLASSYFLEDAVFCMVDGLDECEDDFRDLLDDISKMNFGSRAKICLSSRPEEAMRRKFKDLPSVSLQDLNYEDIFGYARTEFERAGDRTKRLARDVANAAEGVFLWAVLVCDSLCSGLMAEDDTETLLRRLHDSPKELDDLFATMFASIDKFHFQSLAFYFHAAQQDYFSIALAVASQSTQQITSLKQFGALCERETVRIRAQSKGLLEVTFLESESTDTRGWSLRTLPDGRPRERHLGSEDFRVLSRFQESEIGFVHRSAYDYIFKEFGVGPAWLRSVSTPEITDRVFYGNIWLAEYGVHVCKYSNGSCSNRVWQLSKVEHTIPARDLLMLDEERVSEGLRRVFDALCSWESVRADSGHTTLRCAAHEGTDLQKKLNCDDGLDVFGKFWTEVLILKPDFITSNLPRMWDRNDTYSSVVRVMQEWSFRAGNFDTPGLYGLSPQTHCALHSAMTNIRLAGQAKSSIMDLQLQIHPVYSLHKPFSNDGPRLVSWCGVGVPRESAIASRLLDMAWSLESPDEDEQGQSRAAIIKSLVGSDSLQATILENICTIIDRWHLSKGMCAMLSDMPLPLQISLPKLSVRTAVEEYHTAPLPSSASLRLSCFAKQGSNSLGHKKIGQTFTAIATYQLSPKTTGAVMNFGTISRGDFYDLRYDRTQFVGSPTEQFKCTEMVMAELWENPDDQLNAWQQLYLRACVKLYFVHLWREHEDEWRADRDSWNSRFGED